jgi:putative transposase
VGGAEVSISIDQPLELSLKVPEQKAIHAQENRAAARQKAEQVAVKLKERKLADAAALVLSGIDETLSYYAFPSEHWRCLRTNNPLERLLREVRRRTRAVGAFPDGKSALMLAAARLRHVAGTKWCLLQR